MRKPSSHRPDLAKDIRPFVEMLNSKCDSLLDRKIYSETSTIGDIRVMYEELQTEIAKIPAIIEDRDLPIGPTGNISVRIVRPDGNYDKLPVILYIHGGGWMKGSKNTHDRFIRTLANCTNAVVVFPNYSLSPEVKFPVALNECYEVLKYIKDNDYEFNINSDRIAVAGESAGGNMAAVLAMMAKDKSGPKIDFQVLLFPLTNMFMDIDSLDEFPRGPWLTKANLDAIIDAYFENPEDKSNKYASPFLADCEDIEGLPPALIITDENDPLRDDGELYAEKLNDCGVQATSIRFNGTIHNFMILDGLKDSQTAKIATKVTCDALREVLHKDN